MRSDKRTSGPGYDKSRVEQNENTLFFTLASNIRDGLRNGDDVGDDISEVEILALNTEQSALRKRCRELLAECSQIGRLAANKQ